MLYHLLRLRYFLLSCSRACFFRPALFFSIPPKPPIFLVIHLTSNTFFLFRFTFFSRSHFSSAFQTSIVPRRSAISCWISSKSNSCSQFVSQEQNWKQCLRVWSIRFRDMRMKWKSREEEIVLLRQKERSQVLAFSVLERSQISLRVRPLCWARISLMSPSRPGLLAQSRLEGEKGHSKQLTPSPRFSFSSIRFAFHHLAILVTALCFPFMMRVQSSQSNQLSAMALSRSPQESTEMICRGCWMLSLMGEVRRLLRLFQQSATLLVSTRLSRISSFHAAPSCLTTFLTASFTLSFLPMFRTYRTTTAGRLTICEAYSSCRMDRKSQTISESSSVSISETYLLMQPNLHSTPFANSVSMSGQDSACPCLVPMNFSSQKYLRESVWADRAKPLGFYRVFSWTSSSVSTSARKLCLEKSVSCSQTLRIFSANKSTLLNLWNSRALNRLPAAHLSAQSLYEAISPAPQRLRPQAMFILLVAWPLNQQCMAWERYLILGLTLLLQNLGYLSTYSSYQLDEESQRRTTWSRFLQRKSQPALSSFGFLVGASDSFLRFLGSPRDYTSNESAFLMTIYSSYLAQSSKRCIFFLLTVSCILLLYILATASSNFLLIALTALSVLTSIQLQSCSKKQAKELVLALGFYTKSLAMVEVLLTKVKVSLRKGIDRQQLILQHWWTLRTAQRMFITLSPASFLRTVLIQSRQRNSQRKLSLSSQARQFL